MSLLTVAIPVCSASDSLKTTDALLPDKSTVEDLLHFETRAAVQAARRQFFGKAEDSKTVASENEHPVLVAIYGTGRNLSAEVLIAGKTVIFHKGSKQTVSGRSHGYGLVRITPPCIHLQKDQSQEISCLDLVSQ